VTATVGPYSGTSGRRYRSVVKDRRRSGLDAIDRLMRERVGLAPAPVPVPLHKMGAMRATTTTGGQRP
jgi:hypothetical protein